MSSCAKIDCKTTWFSTDYVFDGESGPYTETSEPSPINEYGRAKLRGEIALLGVDSQTLIIRTNVVYGPDPNRKNFVCQILDGKLHTVPDDQYGTPTYNKDIARACELLIDENYAGIVHVTGNEYISRKNLTLEICNHYKTEQKCEFVCTSQSSKQHRVH